MGRTGINPPKPEEVKKDPGYGGRRRKAPKEEPKNTKWGQNRR